MRLNKKSLTLIELMISIVFLSVVMLAAASIDSAFRSSFFTNLYENQLYQDTSGTMERILRDIRHGNRVAVSGNSLTITFPDSTSIQYALNEGSIKATKSGTTETLLTNIQEFTVSGLPTDSPTKGAKVTISAQESKMNKVSFLQSAAMCRVYKGGGSGYVKNQDTNLYYQTIQGAHDALETLSGHTLLCMGNVGADFDGIFENTNVTITKSLTIKGGYNQDFTTQDLANTPTILDSNAKDDDNPSGIIFEINTNNPITMTIQGLSLKNASVALSSAYGLWLMNPYIIIKDCEIAFNEKVANVWASYGNSRLELNKCHIHDNTLVITTTALPPGQFGTPINGIIYFNGGISGDFVIEDSTVENNMINLKSQSGYSGCAIIYGLNGSFHVRRSKIKYNNIMELPETAYPTGCSIIHNTANNITILNSEISNNNCNLEVNRNFPGFPYATSSGAIMNLSCGSSVSAGSVVFNNCTVFGNLYSGGRGTGDILLYSGYFGAVFNLNNSTFKENKITYCNSSSRNIISASGFTTATIANTIISNNLFYLAGNRMSVIYLWATITMGGRCPIKLINTEINRNDVSGVTTYDNAGAYSVLSILNDNDTVIENCSISYNDPVIGGAPDVAIIYMPFFTRRSGANTPRQSLLVTNSNLSHNMVANTASAAGTWLGVIFMREVVDTLTMKNSLLTHNILWDRNSAKAGSIICLPANKLYPTTIGGDNFSIGHITLADNQVRQDDNLLMAFNKTASPPNPDPVRSLLDSIIYGNNSPQPPNQPLNLPLTTVSNSNFQPAVAPAVNVFTAGSGNIDPAINPEFVDAAGNDFHLKESPPLPAPNALKTASSIGGEIGAYGGLTADNPATSLREDIIGIYDAPDLSTPDIREDVKGTYGTIGYTVPAPAP